MTTKSLILHHLSHGRADYKNAIEDSIRQYGPGYETTGRRLRELVQEGKIKREEDGNGNSMYRLITGLGAREIRGQRGNTLFPEMDRLSQSPTPRPPSDFKSL